MPKLKLAIYWAASCGGCDVSVLDLHERILKVSELADIVFWPIALDFKYQDVENMPDSSIDVTLFNGAIRNSENEHLAKLLRKKSKVLVAYGSCAYLGGIPGLTNFYSRNETIRQAFLSTVSTDNPKKILPQESFSFPLGELTSPAFYPRALTLKQVVEVDYFVPGCPPMVDQVWTVIEAIIGGNLPKKGSVIGAGEMALCDECPRKKGEKRIKDFRSIATFIPDTETCLLEQGVICCGPATRSGCKARCIMANMPCRGCYGPPPGVCDQGGKLIASIGAVIDSEDPEEIDRIVGKIEDPAGTFYRFSLPDSLLRASRREEKS